MGSAVDTKFSDRLHVDGDAINLVGQKIPRLERDQRHLGPDHDHDSYISRWLATHLPEPNPNPDHICLGQKLHLMGLLNLSRAFKLCLER
jgi:hypothetical protein